MIPSRQRTVRLLKWPDTGQLYGNLCAAMPEYVVGQGYSLDTLRFAAADGARLELRMSQRGPPGCTVVFMPSAEANTTSEQADVYLNMFAELVIRLAADDEKNDY